MAGLALAGSAADAEPALTPCRQPGLQHAVKCGIARRPLDPARPDGTIIDVHYLVVPAMARRKLPDPVFLLAGGPGQSAIDVAAAVLPLFARLNNRRDIVFVDQRGTGRSAPLACPSTRHEAFADQADPDRQVVQMATCRAALSKLPYVGSPANLGLFTTTLAMQDLDAVRRQLGAERINLVGVSYGTRAALEYQRQFPATVRRSVLDAVAPPDMALPASHSTDGQAALDALLQSCDAEPACHARYPALRDDWQALLRGLPRRVTLDQPWTGAPERFVLTREGVLGAVRGALYAPSVAAALPAAIDAAARGRYAGLAGLAALLGARRNAEPAMGMHFSVVCAEDMPRVDEPGRAALDPPGADFGAEAAAMYRRVCAGWPRGAVPTAFYRVAPSRSPSLVFSGGLDPVTPPRHGERVARALGPAARHVVVPNAGHGVLGVGCARDVVFRFIEAEPDEAATGVDASCLKTIPRPPAYLPAATQTVRER